MVTLDWGELLTFILAAGVAGYSLHAGLVRRTARDEHDLKSAVRKAEVSSPLIEQYEIQREIEALEARLIELKARKKAWTEKPGSGA